MDVVESRIPGVRIFTPTPRPDARGFFSRTFDADVARNAGIDPHAFLQDSLSRSRRGVVRGLVAHGLQGASQCAGVLVVGAGAGVGGVFEGHSRTVEFGPEASRSVGG